MDDPSTKPPPRWPSAAPPLSTTAPTVVRPRPDPMEAAVALERRARAAAREARQAREGFSAEELAMLAYRLRIEGCATCGRSMPAASLAHGPDRCPRCLEQDR